MEARNNLSVHQQEEEPVSDLFVENGVPWLEMPPSCDAKQSPWARGKERMQKTVNPPLVERKCSWASVCTHLHLLAQRAQPLRLHARNIPHRVILRCNGRSVHCRVSGSLPAKHSTLRCEHQKCPLGSKVIHMPLSRTTGTEHIQKNIIETVSLKETRRL